MIKLMVSDLDGTLLDKEGLLNPEFFTLLAQLRKKGVLFAVATGRQTANVKKLFHPVLKDILIASENGAYACDYRQDLFKHPIPGPTLGRLIQCAKNIPDTALFLCTKEIGYLSEHSNRMQEVIAFYNPVYQYRADIESIREDILKVSVCDFIHAKTHALPVIKKQLDGLVEAQASGPVWIDITDRGVNKGEALSAIQQVYGISPAETLIIGDNDNDIHMVAKAAYSFAMKESSRKMRQAARFSAESNAQGGVLKIMNAVLKESLAG